MLLSLLFTMFFGPYEVRIVSDGSYRLDGGSMFGVVPRVLWEPLHAPDAAHRIELALNCLLLRGGGRTILVDTGMGDGFSAAELDRLGLVRPEGDLRAALARAGVAPAEVTDVILTHLHFDHAGGTVVLGEGEPRLAFPNATHWLQEQNLRWAQAPTERDRRSYRGEKWALLLQHGDRLRLLKGASGILPGIQVEVINGHTPGQQLVLIGEDSGERLAYPADLLALASQVRLAWIAAFDLNPLLSLHEKRELLTRAALADWVVVFEHDVALPAAQVRAENGDFRVARSVQL
jgi:glyoxylase-like metal-dependent hydrolase (beta-lactamase superfamily II)